MCYPNPNPIALHISLLFLILSLRQAGVTGLICSVFLILSLPQDSLETSRIYSSAKKPHAVFSHPPPCCFRLPLSTLQREEQGHGCIGNSGILSAAGLVHPQPSYVPCSHHTLPLAFSLAFSPTHSQRPCNRRVFVQLLSAALERAPPSTANPEPRKRFGPRCRGYLLQKHSACAQPKHPGAPR